MEARYVIDMQNSYLILEGKKDSLKSYMSKMILNNKIPGLLLTELRCIDDKECFYYNISLKQSLYNIYENKLIGYLQLKNLLIDIVEILESSSKYLLEEEGFVLSPKNIYIKQDNEETFLCYYVGYDKPLTEQFSKLIEYFLNKVDYKDEEAVLLIYAVYKEIKESNITFEKLKMELNKELKKEKSLAIASNNSEEKTNNEESRTNIKADQSISQVFEDKCLKQKKIDIKRYVLAISSFLVGLIIFLLALQLKLLHNTFKTKIDMVKLVCLLIILICMEGIAMCTIFSKDKKCKDSDLTANYDDTDTFINNETYYLQEESHVSRTKVYIEISPFIIGKNSEGVNYKINDDTISRFHAKIEVLDNEVLLTDLGSTNGSYINDKRIEEHLPYKLRVNDNVMFSRRRFVLKCAVY